MITADTSVVVAAFATWHKAHRPARELAKEGLRLPAHVFLETFSVLTRMPPPHRAEAGLVESFLSRQFPDPALTLSARATRALLKHAVERQIPGGAIYDALIAATASQAGLTLVTLDVRATATYERMGVEYEILQ